MKSTSKRQDAKYTIVTFGVLPCVLGLGVAQLLRWADSVWLSVAGGFWPVVLSATSVAILVKLAFSPFAERTTAIAAWLTLTWTWFHFPLWVTAIEVPHSAAVVDRDGRVHFVSQEAKYPEHRVWFLTNHSGLRIVHNAIGKVIASSIELKYRYAEPYIATRRHGEDLAEPLAAAASKILGEESVRPRSSRIAVLEDRTVQDRVLERICRAAVAGACPIKMSLLPQPEATALGATWSRYYTELEAIEERHLPTLLQLLTNLDSSLADVGKAFALLLEIAEDVAPLSQVAQQPHLLDDAQFDVLIRRILALPGCGNHAVAILSKVNRLTTEQRTTLRAKALEEASIATLLEYAAPLRILDQEIAQLTLRMQSAFSADAGIAVRALTVFGDRLSAESQRDAVASIVKTKASYALSALQHVNFSIEFRRDLMQKVLADADLGDFKTARVSREALQSMLTPAEMRALIATAVQRSQTSGQWLDFTINSLPMRAMTPAERTALLTELLFESPKAALEFVSGNRRYLEPVEVNEVTRDYTRTIPTDQCLHLSHRNKNRKMEYFSDAQLQIFRDCAQSK